MRDIKKVLWTIVAGFATALVLSLAIGLKSHASDPKTLESDYVPMQIGGVSSALSSTWSVSGVGVSYKIFVASNSAGAPNSPFVSYHINWTTGTVRAASGVITNNISSSSETFVPANQLWWDDLHVLGQDPQFVFSNLTANATLYFQLQYGQQRSK